MNITLRDNFATPFSWQRSSAYFMVLALTFTGVFSCCFVPALAQNSHELRATYGRGVHAFFSGQLSHAEQQFSQAISAGSTDPRVYYFRAMTFLRLGRQFEAENDMRLGATFESQNPGGRHIISKSLQRVQGSGRRTLEKFRRQARLQRVQLNRSQTQNRYEVIERRSDAVLYKENPIKLEALVAPNGGAALPNAPGAGSSNASAKSVASQHRDVLLVDPTPATQKEEGDFSGKERKTTTKDDPFGFEELDEGKPSEEATEQELDDDPFGGPVKTLPVEDALFGQEGSPSEVTKGNSRTLGSTAKSPLPGGFFLN